MRMKLSVSKTLLAASMALGLLSAQAQQGKLSGDAVKIGVLTDFSGVYSDYGGQGALVAAKMAVQEIGRAHV